MLVSCGQAAKERKDTATSSSGTTGSDNVTVGNLAFSIADDATDAIYDDTDAGGTSLIGLDTKTYSRTKACTTNGDSAIVKITFSGASERSVKRARVTAALTITASGSETRTWVPPSGKTVTCNAASTAARIPWQDQDSISGLVTQISVDKSRVVTRSVTTLKKTFQTSNTTAIKGTRTVTWSVTTDASSIIRDKKIVTAVTRSGTRVEQDGSKSTIQTEVKSLAEAPLIVRVERALSDRLLTKKTIKSGTLASTQADGSVVQTSFDTLVYDFSSTNDDRCQPISGKMIGKFIPAGASAATKTFIITFGDTSVDSGTSIAYDGGTAEDYPDYNAKGCDLEAES